RALRFAPSARSLLLGLGLLAVAIGAYALARESSAFALERVHVAGAAPHVRQQVREALAQLDGTSLLSLDGAAVVRRVEELPTVIRLKLAIARRALRGLPSGATYLDVSVPGRPVAGPNSQLSGGG